MLTRRRNSKRLQARTGGGRFKRATLADLGIGMQACIGCGRFFDAVKLDTTGPFVAKTEITVCPHCGHDHSSVGQDHLTGERR